MKINYSITNELRNAVWQQTGEKPCTNPHLDIEDTTATPEQRKAFSQLATIQGHANSTYPSITVGTPYINNFGNTSYKSLDEMLTEQNVWPYVFRTLAAMPAHDEALIARRKADDIARQQRKAEQERKRQIREQAAIERAERLERERLARLEAWQNLTFDGNSKAIINLQDALFELSGNEQDDRFRNWAKWISAVEETNDNGYDFVGNFVPDGTVEIAQERQVFLIASTSGSRKYQTTVYRVIVFDPTAEKLWTVTDITTDNSTRGWALRIRDDVKGLLNV